MAYEMRYDDFAALMLSGPRRMREPACLNDAWPRFATFDGTAMQFKHWALTNEEEPKDFWFEPEKTSSGAATGHPALYDLTAQGQMVREIGSAAAADFLKSEGLKLGQIKAPAKADDVADSTNPYADGFKGDRESRIASLIKQGGTGLAARLAKAAGKTITGQPLLPAGAARRT